jgi:predicted anti-sigma-YlaC factor YlaD
MIPRPPRSNWIGMGLKLVAALVALALVRPWGRGLPRRPLLAAAWLTAAVRLLHVAAGTIQTTLAAVGVLSVEGTTYEGHIGDYLLWEAVWEPWWLLGAALFALAARARARS